MSLAAKSALLSGTNGSSERGVGGVGGGCRRGAGGGLTASLARSRCRRGTGAGDGLGTKMTEVGATATIRSRSFSPPNASTSSNTASSTSRVSPSMPARWRRLGRRQSPAAVPL
jgi:hypothetical protein